MSRRRSHGARTLRRPAAWLVIVGLLFQALLAAFHVPPAVDLAAQDRAAPDAFFGGLTALCLAQPQDQPGAPGNTDRLPAPKQAFCPICQALQHVAAYVPPVIAAMPRPPSAAATFQRGPDAPPIARRVAYDARPRAPPFVS